MLLVISISFFEIRGGVAGDNKYFFEIRGGDGVAAGDIKCC